MTEHGITTTRADYWVHLCPQDSAAYWYRVDVLREFINLKKLPTTFGKSKNGIETGAGFLVPKGHGFIVRVEVPLKYLSDFSWNNMTDREKGRTGQFVVLALIDHRVLQFPFARAVELKSRELQLSGQDIGIRYFKEFSVEVKTDCKESGNLFVQSHEHGHNPNLLKQGETVTTKVTELHSDEVPF